MEDIDKVFTWLGIVCPGIWAVFIYLRAQGKEKQKEANESLAAPVIQGAPVGATKEDFFRDKAVGLYETQIADLKTEVKELERELMRLEGLLRSHDIDY